MGEARSGNPVLARPYWVGMPGFVAEADSEGLGWTLATAALGTFHPAKYGPVKLDHPGLCYVTSPGASLQTRRDTRIPLLPGRLQIMPEDGVIAGSIDVPARGIALSFNRHLMTGLSTGHFAAMGDSRLLRELYNYADPLAESLMLALSELLMRRDPRMAAYADQLATSLLLRLLDPSRGDPSGPRTSGLQLSHLALVREFISSRLERRIRVSELACLCGLGETQFARLFKRSMGLPPHQYILRARVMQAKRQLAASDDPVVRIAMDCGFADQEHLSRIFRRSTGMTPVAFRRQHRGGIVHEVEGFEQGARQYRC